MPVFNLTAHENLWDWLAANPGEPKEHWTGWKRNGGIYDDTKIHGLCFACQYAKELKEELMSQKDICCFCPLVWPAGSCTGIDSEDESKHYLFDEWLMATFQEDKATAVRKAKIISELPLQPSVQII